MLYVLRALVGGLLLMTACGGATEYGPTEDDEFDIGGEWIAAGQPDEARLEELVGFNARIISIRPQVEDPFNEPAVVAAAGGSFVRFPVVKADYDSVAFRESLYDFIEAELAKPGRVYFHCRSGNRIGAAWALYHAERKGMSAEAAVELGRKAGLGSLDPKVLEILGLPAM